MGTDVQRLNAELLRSPAEVGAKVQRSRFSAARTNKEKVKT